MHDQPIVACATPRGEGAVSIVRMSGTGVFAIADRCFRPVGNQSFSDVAERSFVFGAFVELEDQENTIDRCLAVRFIAPRSFSGEDTVEFHVHGNPLIVESVVRTCVRLGCRLAEPGEFSRRAFLNGKMDLSQAEALAEVIRAESRAALDLAQRQLGGALSDRLREFRRKLVDFLALLELELDFVQEGYELIDYAVLKRTVLELREFTDTLLDMYRGGDRLRRGPRVLLLGRPNAGKSSLFNAILGYSRALVSDIPGTTRDYLEERVLHGDVVLHLLDTAGLRSAADRLEAEGVSRAQELLGVADHVLYLIDSTLPEEACLSEIEYVNHLKSTHPDTTIVPVYTKADRGNPPPESLFCSIFERSTVIALLDQVVREYSATVSDRMMLLSERQFLLLQEVRQQLEEIDIDSSLSTEFLSSDLRQVLRPISELTGEITNEHILDAVFSGFCIGK